MKIAYLIEGPVEKKVRQSNFIEIKVDETQDYSKIDLSKYDYCCILPNQFQLSDNYEDIMSVYLKEDTILLPLTILQTEAATGVLNSCVWNSNLTAKLGELDNELAIKQIDLTMYGALIPTKFIKPEFFKEGLKYYQHFHFFNKVTSEDIAVVGVPKTLLSTTVDLTFSSVSNDEKLKFFNMAKEGIEIESAETDSVVNKLKAVK